MQGSPLLVSNVVSEIEPTVNVALPDGRIMAIRPERGIRVSQLPPLDPTILDQLRLLKENLRKICKDPN